MNDLQKLALSKLVIDGLPEAREAITPGDYHVAIRGLDADVHIRVGNDGRRRIVNKIDWTAAFLYTLNRLNLLEKAAGETETSLVDIVAEAMAEKPTLSKEAKDAAQAKVDALKDETWTDVKGPVSVKSCAIRIAE